MVQAKTLEGAEFYKKLGFQASDTDSMLFFQLVKDVKKSLESATRVG